MLHIMTRCLIIIGQPLPSLLIPPPLPSFRDSSPLFTHPSLSHRLTSLRLSYLLTPLSSPPIPSPLHLVPHYFPCVPSPHLISLTPHLLRGEGVARWGRLGCSEGGGSPRSPGTHPLALAPLSLIRSLLPYLHSSFRQPLVCFSGWKGGGDSGRPS